MNTKDLAESSVPPVRAASCEGEDRAVAWQPISSAPKDGTKVLLLCGGESTTGWWAKEEYMSKPKPFWASERAYIFGKTWARNNPPTHWMPLPSPPSEGTARDPAMHAAPEATAAEAKP